jgi:MYXO-CTERM domain-containing protein
MADSWFQYETPTLDPFPGSASLRILSLQTNMQIKKILSPCLATLLFGVTCFFAYRVAEIPSRTRSAEEASPPAMLSLAGGVLVLLGLVRRRHSV